MLFQHPLPMRALRPWFDPIATDAFLMSALIERFRRTVRELRTANRANVTVTFALSTIPIVGFVGAAVDYSHANSVKTALHAPAEYTALMLSKTAATEPSSQLTTQANSYFKALFTRPDATGLTVTATS